jgi:hypothetical protein
MAAIPPATPAVAVTKPRRVKAVVELGIELSRVVGSLGRPAREESSKRFNIGMRLGQHLGSGKGLRLRFGYRRPAFGSTGGSVLRVPPETRLPVLICGK